MEKLPPSIPFYTGGETNVRGHYDVAMQRVLPLCKGELEGVVVYPLPTKEYINEDIPAKMKLSPVQMMMLNIPNRG